MFRTGVYFWVDLFRNRIVDISGMRYSGMRYWIFQELDV